MGSDNKLVDDSSRAFGMRSYSYKNLMDGVKSILLRHSKYPAYIRKEYGIPNSTSADVLDARAYKFIYDCFEADSDWRSRRDKALHPLIRKIVTKDIKVVGFLEGLLGDKTPTDDIYYTNMKMLFGKPDVAVDAMSDSTKVAIASLKDEIVQFANKWKPAVLGDIDNFEYFEGLVRSSCGAIPRAKIGEYFKDENPPDNITSKIKALHANMALSWHKYRFRHVAQKLLDDAAATKKNGEDAADHEAEDANSSKTHGGDVDELVRPDPTKYFHMKFVELPRALQVYVMQYDTNYESIRTPKKIVPKPSQAIMNASRPVFVDGSELMNELRVTIPSVMDSIKVGEYDDLLNNTGGGGKYTIDDLRADLKFLDGSLGRVHELICEYGGARDTEKNARFYDKVRETLYASMAKEIVTHIDDDGDEYERKSADPDVENLFKKSATGEININLHDLIGEAARSGRELADITKQMEQLVVIPRLATTQPLADIHKLVVPDEHWGRVRFMIVERGIRKYIASSFDVRLNLYLKTFLTNYSQMIAVQEDAETRPETKNDISVKFDFLFEKLKLLSAITAYFGTKYDQYDPIIIDESVMPQTREKWAGYREYATIYSMYNNTTPESPIPKHHDGYGYIFDFMNRYDISPPENKTGVIADLIADICDDGAGIMNHKLHQSNPNRVLLQFANSDDVDDKMAAYRLFHDRVVSRDEKMSAQYPPPSDLNALYETISVINGCIMKRESPVFDVRHYVYHVVRNAIATMKSGGFIKKNPKPSPTPSPCDIIERVFRRTCVYNSGLFKKVWDRQQSANKAKAGDYAVANSNQNTAMLYDEFRFNRYSRGFMSDKPDPEVIALAVGAITKIQTSKNRLFRMDAQRFYTILPYLKNHLSTKEWRKLTKATILDGKQTIKLNPDTLLPEDFGAITKHRSIAEIMGADTLDSSFEGTRDMGVLQKDASNQYARVAQMWGDMYGRSIRRDDGWYRQSFIMDLFSMFEPTRSIISFKHDILNFRSGRYMLDHASKFAIRNYGDLVRVDNDGRVIETHALHKFKRLWGGAMYTESGDVSALYKTTRHATQMNYERIAMLVREKSTSMHDMVVLNNQLLVFILDKLDDMVAGIRTSAGDVADDGVREFTEFVAKHIRMHDTNRNMVIAQKRAIYASGDTSPKSKKSISRGAKPRYNNEIQNSSDMDEYLSNIGVIEISRETNVSPLHPGIRGALLFV